MAFQQFQKLYISPEDMKDPKDLARVINALQANVQDAVNPMSQKIQNDSLILTNVALAGPDQLNVINHTLGRPLIGWVVIRQRAGSLVYDNQDANKSPQLTLWLYSLFNTNIDILVF